MARAQCGESVGDRANRADVIGAGPLDRSRAGLGGTPLATGTDGDRVYDVSKRLQESLAEDVAQHGVADGLTMLCRRLGHVVDPGAAADFEGRGLARLSNTVAVGWTSRTRHGAGCRPVG